MGEYVSPLTLRVSGTGMDGHNGGVPTYGTGARRALPRRTPSAMHPARAGTTWVLTAQIRSATVAFGKSSIAPESWGLSEAMESRGETLSCSRL